MPNTNHIGDVSEAQILVRLLNHGYIVSRPFNDAPYDFIAENSEGKLFKVQCKTGRYNQDIGVISVRFTRVGTDRKSKQYSNKEVDIFAIYCPELDCCYLVPFENAPNTQMFLRVDAPTKTDSNINWAEDYKGMRF